MGKPSLTAKPTSIPTEIRLPTTSSPTLSLSPTNEGCFSNNYKDCLPKSQLNGPASCDTVWLPNGPQQGCVALWGDCTDGGNSCCGDAVCFGDGDRAICAPSDSTDSPTSKPTTPGPSPSPTAKPTSTPTEIPLPTTFSPTFSFSPTNAPVTGGPPPCFSEYQDCTNSASSCCEGYKCVQFDLMGNSKCLADTCDKGPNPPPSPSSPPSPPPTKGNPPTGEPAVGCCSRDLGTCTHLDNSFCNANKENCEGPCGKVWLPSGDISNTCLPLWEKG